MFLQSNVEDVDNVLDKLIQATEQTGFLGLGIWGKCNCDNCNLVPGKLVRIREIWALATGTLCFATFRPTFADRCSIQKYACIGILRSFT